MNILICIWVLFIGHVSKTTKHQIENELFYFIVLYNWPNYKTMPTDIQRVQGDTLYTYLNSPHHRPISIQFMYISINLVLRDEMKQSWQIGSMILNSFTLYTIDKP